MRRTIGYMIRMSMYVSARLGSHWWEIERDWHDIVDYQMGRVFKPVEDESEESKVAEPRCCAACSGFDGEEGYTDCMSALNRRRLPMVKTEEQKAAWLDGYRAATDTAASFKVRVDGGEVDEALNLGARMVASLLTRNVEKFTVPKERLE